MADPNQNDNGETLETVQVSAGEPKRQPPLAELGLALDIPEPSAADLDNRQAAIGETRRSGPPLPEDEEPDALALADPGVEEQPTEVKEPRPKDR